MSFRCRRWSVLKDGVPAMLRHCKYINHYNITVNNQKDKNLLVFLCPYIIEGIWRVFCTLVGQQAVVITNLLIIT